MDALTPTAPIPVATSTTASTADDDLHRRFPAHFTWGVATSAFQIEGAPAEDGKGESIWDRFCKRPGVIADGSNGDVACDHYHRLEPDLDLIASLGVDLYRFSISWPRVQPAGAGAWNEKGLDFYERVVDGLLARGVQPHLTLNHWDLPQALQDRGGWNARDTVHRFVDYARGINERLGDRLATITTHNEPWVVATLGHEAGAFAPGIQDRRIAAQVSHHLLLSHGLAVQALRADDARAKLGIVLNMTYTMPATDSDADRAQARMDDAKSRRWYADPLFLGRYPREAWDELGDDAPRMEANDLHDIQVPIDFLGINYYTRHVASAGARWDPKAQGLPITAMDWEIYPQGLTELLLQLHREYDLPAVYITENGGAFPDDDVKGGVVQDADRTAYLRGHIAAVANAMKAGVPVGSYMVWSLMDNFEWASGYAKRFGIVHVDYDTLARTPKASAAWFRGHVERCRTARAEAALRNGRHGRGPANTGR